MKVSVIINIVLAVALVVAIVIIARGTASSNETVAKDNSNETISSIMSRVSVRAYTEQPAVKDKWQPSYIHYEMWGNAKE